MTDVVITAHYDEKSGTLGYNLNIENPKLGLITESYPKQELSGNSLSVIDALFHLIEESSPSPLNRANHKADTKHDDERLAAMRRLEGIGEDLFQELMPEKLRDRLRTLVAVGTFPAATFQIRSDETFIPWELLRIPGNTPDRSGVFLAEAFGLTRWLLGHEQVTELPLREIALVTARQSELPYAGDEHGFVSSLSDDDHHVEEVEARYVVVMDAVDSRRHDGWHFTGHGVTFTENSSLWGLQLDDHRTLTSYDLGSASGLGANRPLVFANACHSGRGGPGLTRTGGLARAFLNAGAGAYVGCHWALYDEPAYEFARAFYSCFLEDVLPIGEAVRRARLEIRELFPGDPIWLAYTVFAHPLASCAPSYRETEAPSAPHDRPAPDHSKKRPPVRRRRGRTLRKPWPPFHRGLAASLLALVAILGPLTYRWGEHFALTLRPEEIEKPDSPGRESDAPGSVEDPGSGPVPGEATQPAAPGAGVRGNGNLNRPTSPPRTPPDPPQPPRVAERKGVCVRVPSGDFASSEAHALLVAELKARNLAMARDSRSCRWRIDGEVETESKEERLFNTTGIFNSARVQLAIVDAKSSRTVHVVALSGSNTIQNADVGCRAALQDAVKSLFIAHPEILKTLIENEGGH